MTGKPKRRIAYAYNPISRVITLMVYDVAHNTVIDSIDLDETSWDEAQKTHQIAQFKARQANWGKCETVLKAEQTLLDIQKGINNRKEDGLL